MKKFFIILAALAVFPLAISFTGNPFGAFACSYISTALVMFSVYEFARRLKRHEAIKPVIPVAAVGVVTGLFMNMADVVGPSVYLSFLVGQAVTVALVLWLTRTLSPAPILHAESAS